MFEIGPALREARERRGLSYSQVEADIAIRSRYVRALEEEEFSILPGPVYTKGFLRAYAEYLNLDGQLFVDEFNSRHHDPRREFDQPIASQPRSRPQQRHRRRRESQLVLIALAAIVAVTSIIFLVGLKGSPNVATINPPTTTNTTPTTGSTGSTGSTGTTTTTKKQHKKKPVNKNVTVVLTASGGGCWVSVHKSSGGAMVSTSGQDLSGYTIDPSISPTVTFVGKTPMTMQVGAPGSIAVTINGKAAPLPDGTSTSSTLKITSTGVTIG